jgi:hypothetical protein
MKKCKEKSEIWASEGYDAVTIGCDFEAGHGGKHQKVLNQHVLKIETVFTVRWMPVKIKRVK